MTGPPVRSDQTGADKRNSWREARRIMLRDEPAPPAKHARSPPLLHILALCPSATAAPHDRLARRSPWGQGTLIGTPLLLGVTRRNDIAAASELAASPPLHRLDPGCPAIATYVYRRKTRNSLSTPSRTEPRLGGDHSRPLASQCHVERETIPPQVPCCRQE
jgi:hypothetical protein